LQVVGELAIDVMIAVVRLDTAPNRRMSNGRAANGWVNDDRGRTVNRRTPGRAVTVGERVSRVAERRRTDWTLDGNDRTTGNKQGAEKR
jgi:hypothetical protein